ncbi:hypothetical protein J6590_104006 [Homalodisca vitripennis]|nr:hypothetical protein J6590_104006 [Homalodisca vitripennis]
MTYSYMTYYSVVALPRDITTLEALFHTPSECAPNTEDGSRLGDCLEELCALPFIDYSCELTPVKVVCEDGREYSASHVIVTSSLGYLKENHRTLCHPSLPIDIGKAIDIMGFDTINKLFLVYDNAWWPENFQGIQLIWNCEEKEDADHQSWVSCASGFDVVADMPAVLLSRHMVGERGRGHGSTV